jgi:hypothetical protein
MRSASPAASPRERRHRVIAAKAEEANCGDRRWKSAQDVHRPAASNKMPGDGALTLLEDMCNLYSLTKDQAAIRDWSRAKHDRTGNLPLFPRIFPDQFAPIVRSGADGTRDFRPARGRARGYPRDSRIAGSGKAAEGHCRRDGPEGASRAAKGGQEEGLGASNPFA